MEVAGVPDLSGSPQSQALFGWVTSSSLTRISDKSLKQKGLVLVFWNNGKRDLWEDSETGLGVQGNPRK